MMGQSDDNNQDSEKRAKFECPICGKEYDKEYEEVHMKSHNENQFTCVICNRKFDLQENLTLHIKGGFRMFAQFKKSLFLFGSWNGISSESFC